MAVDLSELGKKQQKQKKEKTCARALYRWGLAMYQ
jgi:hypothetical protein